MICDKYNVEYIDYNQKFNVLKFDKSYYADEKHLNLKSATKLSELLALNLKKLEITKDIENKGINAPEDFVYSDKFDFKQKTIYSGKHVIVDSIAINEVNVAKLSNGEFSLIVKWMRV